ncbi:twin-arginine translocase TatA/TatE family subunit [Pelagibius sp.]|uniref:twin-arginine translocase TatA/TatE family subunit n=1 Tax=Pelagibius sp. TaxID=1931238 RepID=UPI003BAFD93E
MGTFSIWHWLIVLVVVLVLFGGGGKIPKLMRDMGQGINAFKKGLKEDQKGKDKDKAAEGDDPKVIDQDAPAMASEEKDKAANG